MTHTPTKNSETAPFYMTVLVKYESEADAPRVGANEAVLGGKMVGVSFTDMFAEMEELQSNTRAPEPTGISFGSENLTHSRDGDWHSPSTDITGTYPERGGGTGGGL